MGSQALPGGLWDTQPIVCSGQQGEGQKWQLAGQEPLQQPQQQEMQTAGGEGYSANFNEDTHYRVCCPSLLSIVTTKVPELKLQLLDSKQRFARRRLLCLRVSSGASCVILGK